MAPTLLGLLGAVGSLTIEKLETEPEEAEINQPSSLSALNGRLVSCVSPVGSLARQAPAGGGGGGGGGAEPVVVAETIFERLPNTALRFSVPRNAISWRLYFVAGVSPRTVQVSWLPIAVPAIGVLQVPLVVDVAEPHVIGATA